MRKRTKTKKKQTKARSRKPTTCKEMLKIIREFFDDPHDLYVEDDNAGFIERKKLWDILCALRGPDNHNSPLKSSTTAVIRMAALGKHSHPVCVADFAEDEKRSVSLRKTLHGEIEDHFNWHAWMAFEALGLKWDELNEV